LQDFQHQRASGRLEPRANAAKQAEGTAAAEDKKRIARLEARNRQLEHKLQQAELVIDIQKKVSLLLGVVLPAPPDESNGEPSW
jgi:hypothetical protein